MKLIVYSFNKEIPRELNGSKRAKISCKMQVKNLLIKMHKNKHEIMFTKTIVDQLPRDERDLLTRDKTFIIPNIVEEQRMFEWAGIVFGEETSVKLSKAIKRLAILSGASQLRFWGKIYGTQKDYWIVEGSLDTQEEDKQSSDQEKRGEGVNRYVYWVCDNILEDWIQLPDLQPEHIQVARMIKHVFTGNLNSIIDSNPPYPGKERHYLRAQIARITHGTEMIKMEADENNNDVIREVYQEGYQVPGTEELRSLESWQHRHGQILKAGRLTHIVPAGYDDLPDEEKEIFDKIKEKDPQFDELFRSASEDTAVEGYKSAWLSRVVGDPQPFAQTPPKEAASYAINVIKNLRWPGSTTVSQNGNFQSIYVGYGMKRGDVCFNPTEPPEVQKDPKDQMEQPEPTPLHAPKAPVVDLNAEQVPPEDDE